MKKVVLCILDGVGLREEEHGNAFKQAKTPNFDYLWENYPHTSLFASGEPVGIPDGQMGSSEVGHSNMGAGRIVYNYFVRINNAIKDKSFFQNEELIGAINNCKKNNSNLHICGMVSDGGVHSHINHLLALLELCKMHTVKVSQSNTFDDIDVYYNNEMQEETSSEKVNVDEYK